MEYFRIPGTVLKDNSISPLSRLLYGVVYKYAYNGKADMFCWASNRHLSEMFNVSQKTIERSIGELTRKKYVEVEYCKGKTRKIFPQCELSG